METENIKTAILCQTCKSENVNLDIFEDEKQLIICLDCGECYEKHV